MKVYSAKSKSKFEDDENRTSSFADIAKKSGRFWVPEQREI